MKRRIEDTLVVILLAIVPTLAIWILFFLKRQSFWGIPLPQDGMATIVANYDGPLYIVIAKTFYNLEKIATNFSFPLPNEYWAAHFPLYPAIIRLLSYLVGGYPYAMLLATLLSSIAAVYYFKKIISQYVPKSQILWMCLLFSIFPARWLTVRSVGSPEPLFLAVILASIYYFQNKKFFAAAFFGILAQLTKSPGSLLFVAYAASLLAMFFRNHLTARKIKFEKLTQWNAWPVVVLIPLSLVGLFSFYSFRFGDFFAYFNSGDNIHLFFPPFQIFNYSAYWVGTFWLEEIILVYLICILGIIKLAKLFRKAPPEKKYLYDMPLWFSIVFFVSILFVSHRDVIRYALPIFPFLLIAWSSYLTKTEFKIAFLVLVIPIFLFTLSFISQNVMPIPDWGPLL